MLISDYIVREIFIFPWLNQIGIDHVCGEANRSADFLANLGTFCCQFFYVPLPPLAPILREDAYGTAFAIFTL